MYALTPSGRKRAQLLVQLNNQQRKTRQIDANKRQTNNSRNEKLFSIEQDIAKRRNKNYIKMYSIQTLISVMMRKRKMVLKILLLKLLTRKIRVVVQIISILKMII